MKPGNKYLNLFEATFLTILMLVITGCGGTPPNNIVIAVLDTGIDETIPEFKNRLTGGKNEKDDNGHGTYIARIIAENTPNTVKILPIKVVDENGEGTEDALADGIRKAVKEGADIINISLAMENDSEIIKNAVLYADRKGVIVVCSAGNYGEDVSGYTPANIPECITVGTLEDGEIAGFSNYGNGVDVFIENPDRLSEDGESYSGTSVSAAYISAYIAESMEREGKEHFTSKDIEEIAKKIN